MHDQPHYIANTSRYVAERKTENFKNICKECINKALCAFSHLNLSSFVHNDTRHCSESCEFVGSNFRIHPSQIWQQRRFAHWRKPDKPNTCLSCLCNLKPYQYSTSKASIDNQCNPVYENTCRKGAATTNQTYRMWSLSFVPWILPPPDDDGVSNSLFSFANFAFNNPRCAFVALFFWVRAISASMSSIFWIVTASAMIEMQYHKAIQHHTAHN